MSFSRAHNIGGYLKTAIASALTALTAGGAGDNTEVVGDALDRTLVAYPLSMRVNLNYQATLAANKKLTLKTVVVETSDSSTFATGNVSLATPADADVLVDSGSGSTIKGQTSIDVDLASAKRYVRVRHTPDLNAANTDTAITGVTVVWGGTDSLS